MKVYCSRCHFGVASTVRICPKCGNRSFTSQKRSQTSARTPRSSRLNQPTKQAPSQSVLRTEKKSWFSGRMVVFLTGLAVFIVIALGISAVVIVQQQRERVALEEQRAEELREEAERKAEEEEERKEAVVREITDDIGRMVFQRMNRKLGLGRYSGAELDNWDYHPLKDRYVLDLTVNWEGKISGDDYWVEARAYVHSDYIKGNDDAEKISFEIRSKSSSLIEWEQTIGGIAIGIGVIEALSQ